MSAPDQVTRFREQRRCSRCLSLVTHRQVVRYAKPSGFKTYEWEPVAHRALDGSTCPARQEGSK